jgi:hypothetical protein
VIWLAVIFGLAAIVSPFINKLPMQTVHIAIPIWSL